MKLPLLISSALILSLSSAWAVAPLAAGKPAGVRQAQLEDGNGMFVVAGAALVGIVIGIATAGDDAGQTPATNPSPPTTTTGTSP
jgi:hypothetical protein